MARVETGDRVEAEYETFDDYFSSVTDDRWLARVHSGSGFTEGPVWFPAGRYLLFSDIPGDRILKWDETTGASGVFRESAGNPNGNTIDREGRLITCEHSNRRVTRTNHNGSISVLADHFGRRRLNSPNDVVVRSDRSIWFTDPTYGIADGDSETGSRNVYRIDPSSGLCEVVVDDFDQPNGLAFSVDEQTLFISDSRRNHLRVFTVAADGKTLRGGAVMATCDVGNFDGFRLDEHGRLWAGAGDGVHCYNLEGALLGKIKVPEVAANVAFGGVGGDLLFITATTSLYTLRLGVRGAPLT
jgi:gluconolactonase